MRSTMFARNRTILTAFSWPFHIQGQNKRRKNWDIWKKSPPALETAVAPHYGEVRDKLQIMRLPFE